ncbi:MAG TPA: AMP-binding protein [Alphaproteobacteria bacterium]|nr:AMP-binding protein [Alphaproteobacteria bacterium]
MTATTSEQSPVRTAEEIEARVLAVVDKLSRELQPGKRPGTLGPESVLDRDLGIDSLGRVEMRIRLERALGADLSEEAVMHADTISDLFSAASAALPLPPAPVISREPITAPRDRFVEPRLAKTLIDALEHHLDVHPDLLHMQYLDGAGAVQPLSYGELWRRAQTIATGLRELLVEERDPVAIMLPTGIDFFATFIAILLAGAVPVSIYPPQRRAQAQEHLLRQAGILRNAGARVLITSPEAALFGQLIKAQVETIHSVVTVEALTRAGVRDIRAASGGAAVALLQYTSGSTGNPKGVILSHENVLANIRALGQALDVRAEDVVVSWLPPYHDMGLIGSWMGSLYYGLPFVVMSPLSFLGRPERWLWAIHRFHGTLSAAPNFAYELCVQKIADRRIQGLDLSSWRMAGNGAEAVQADTIARFAARFAAYGFRTNAMTPMYGLAENAVALTVSPVGRGPRIDRVDRAVLGSLGRAEPAAEEDPRAATFVSSGVPIPGHEVRILGPSLAEAMDREEGHIQFRGPSATSGYCRDPEKTAALRQGEWLNTGDRGYIDQGELFVTGRIKDIVVRAGRKLHPEEIEAAVGEIAGVRTGRVAVFASPDPRTGTERLVVVAETRLLDAGARDTLRRQIIERSTAILEAPPEEVVLAAAGTVPKTANGKLRRAACRILYEQGNLERSAAPFWRQIAGLLLASLAPELRRVRRAAGSVLYAAYFQLLYRLMAPAVWLGLMATPSLPMRRRLFGDAARLFLKLIGMTPETIGLERLPCGRPYLIFANHGSYLDGLVLAAVLPPHHAFVAKRELVGRPVAGRFLERLGVAFIERFDTAAALDDLRALSRRLLEGQPLIVFPEGTFDRRPGLRAFHMGAFLLAAEMGAPAVPAAIRGTRAALRAGSNFARHGRVLVTLADPIEPDGKDWAAAIRLRDRVRSALLRDCGEPDLAHERTAVDQRVAEARHCDAHAPRTSR